MTDKVVHFDQRFNELKENGLKIYMYLNEKVYSPLKDNLYIIYDQSSQYVTYMIKIISENQ